MRQHRIGKRFCSIILLGLTSCLLIACPASETKTDRLRTAAAKAVGQYAHEHTWKVVAYDNEPIYDDFLIRFDNQRNMTHVYDGCREYSLPLSLNTRLETEAESALDTVEDCDRLDSTNAQIIYDHLLNMTGIEGAYRGTIGTVELTSTTSNNLTLEPADLSLYSLSESLFGQAVKEGSVTSPELIASGQNIDGARRELTIMRTPEEVNYLWNNILLPESTAQVDGTIDFNNNLLIGSTLADQEYTGHKTEMSDLVARGGWLYTTISHTKPHLSCFPDSSVSSVAALFKVPTRERNIATTVVGRTADPCDATGLNGTVVRNIRVTALNDLDIELEWDAPVIPGDRYEVLVGDQVLQANENGIVITGLVPYIQHEIVVRTQSDIGQSDARLVVRTHKTHDQQLYGYHTSVYDVVENHTRGFASNIRKISAAETKRCGKDDENTLIGFDGCAADYYKKNIPFVDSPNRDYQSEDREEDFLEAFVFDGYGRLFYLELEAKNINEYGWLSGNVQGKLCETPVVNENQLLCE